jgi:ribonuclease HI
MDIKADIKWIRQELKKVKDPTLIEAFKNLLQYRKKVSSERIDVEQYNKEIDESIAQIERGEFYTHQEMGERVKQWGKR